MQIIEPDDSSFGAPKEVQPTFDELQDLELSTIKKAYESAGDVTVSSALFAVGTEPASYRQEV